MQYAVEMVSGDMIYVTKFHDNRFRHSSDRTVIISTFSEALLLVLLMEGICAVRRWDGLR
jgi:hypothetical protein